MVPAFVISVICGTERGRRDSVFDFIREVAGGKQRALLAAALIAAIGGFLFGYDTGVVSGALLYIKQDFGAGNFAQEAVVSSLVIGAVAGAALSGWTSDRFGRRVTKIGSGSVYVVGALGSAAAQTIAELVAIRFVLGMAVGAASFVSVEYISELVPPRFRGGLTSFNQLMVVTGIFVAYVVNWFLSGGGHWRWMLGLAAVPGAALAIGMVFMPESPRWLVQKGRYDRARDVLVRLGRTNDEVDEEMDGISDVVENQRKGLRHLFDVDVRPMVVVGLALAVFQQLVGINTIIYYAPTILQFAGGGGSSDVIARTVFVGVTNIVMTIVAVLLLDRVGRRPLLIIGTIGLTLSMIVLGAFFVFTGLQESAPWLALACLVFYVGSYAVGLGPVFWLMISEIYPLGIRSEAMAGATMANWATNFLVSATFLTVVGVVGKGATFWIYAALGAMATAFFVWKVPETKGRSLEEIENDVGASR